MGWSLRGLGARFDGAALRPFEAVAAGTTDWPALRAWCLSPGRWSVAAADAIEARNRVARVALQLDGSDRLAACASGLQRIALKLRVKIADLGAGVDVAPGDIWDSGHVPDDDAALAALTRFTPRRPTLIVIDGAAPPRVQAVLQALQARQAGWRRPVRVLLLGASRGAVTGAIALRD